MSWFRYDTDVCAEFESGNYEFLQRYATKNSGLLFKDWESGNGGLSGALKVGVSILKRFERKCTLDEMKKSIFMMGELSGLIKALAQFDTHKSKETFTMEQYTKYGGVKHLNDIVEVLYKEGALTQADLAENLKMSTSALSECLKRVMGSNFIIAEKSGKFKYFTLSEYGRRYYGMLEKKREELDRNAELYSNYYRKKYGASDDVITNMSFPQHDELDGDDFGLTNSKKVIPINYLQSQKKNLIKKENIIVPNISKGGSEIEDVREN